MLFSSLLSFLVRKLTFLWRFANLHDCQVGGEPQRKHDPHGVSLSLISFLSLNVVKAQAVASKRITKEGLVGFPATVAFFG